MIENNSEKKRLFYTIVLLLTLIIMIIGASLAYYRLVDSQKEKGTTLYSGTLNITYLDGTYIKNPELFPMSNVTYNTKENVYRNNFKVTSTGSLDQTIAVDMIISTNTFSTNALKYALYNSTGARLATGTVPTSGPVNFISNIYLEHGKTANFTLIIWWDNTGYNQTNELTSDSTESIVSGKLSITAKQIKY